MFQLLVINGGAAPTESESVSRWDGGHVADLSFRALAVEKRRNFCRVNPSIE